MKRRVLALGLDPRAVDLGDPRFPPEMVRAHIDLELARVEELGLELVSCLVDPEIEPVKAAAAALGSGPFDVVLFGAGLRDAAQLLLFEQLINLVHKQAPHAKLCFNSRPGDSAQAVERCL